MSDPDALVTTLAETAPSAELTSWWVYVAFHRDVAALGHGRRCLPGSRVELSRDGTALGHGVLDDARISRNHAVIEVDATDTLTVTDVASSNGTYVNGRRVDRAILGPGDVVRVGGLLLVPRRARVGGGAAASSPWQGPSEAARRTHAAIDAALGQGAPVAMFGDPCCGAREAALEAYRQRGGPWSETPLEGCGERLPDAWIAAATRDDGGVLFTRGLPIAGSAAEQGLAELIGASGTRANAPWMVFDPGCGDGTASGLGRAAALGLRVIELPALRARTEDLGAMARAWCDARQIAWPLGGYREWQALLCAPWQGNLAQFEAVLVALAAPSHDLDAVDLSSLLTRSAWAEPTVARSTSLAVPTGERVSVAIDGRWFLAGAAGRVSLHRRPVLARLLRALVRHRTERPTSVLSAAALIAETWPGERLVEGSGDNRLHVALTHLRQLGLRRVIERVEDGYRIAPSVNLDLHDE